MLTGEKRGAFALKGSNWFVRPAAECRLERRPRAARGRAPPPARRGRRAEGLRPAPPRPGQQAHDGRARLRRRLARRVPHGPDPGAEEAVEGAAQVRVTVPDPTIANACPFDSLPRQMPRVVDLSHPIEHGMITYPGLPGPVISDFLGREASRGHYAEGTTFQIARVRMVVNTGTYLDAPFHRYAHGVDVGSLALERLADLEALVVDATGGGRGAVRRRGALRRPHARRPRRARPHGLGRALADASLLRRVTRTSRAARPSCWRPPAPRSSASTRSTSTTRPTACARRTRSCSARGSPSSSTSADWTRCRRRARASTACRRRFAASGASRSGRTRSCA